MDVTPPTDSDPLVDIVRRLPILDALHGNSLCREEVERRLAISSPTYYRRTHWLNDMGLLEESGERIALSSAGEVITEEAIRFETTITTTLHQSETDRTLFANVIRHSLVLEALEDGPRDRRELERQLDVSKTTGYRVTRSLEDVGLIEKSRGRYVLTSAGERVREAASTFETNVQTALRLGPVLGPVRDTTPALDLEALADATVTTSERGDIHSPVNRFILLVQETDSLRGVDINSITPLYIMDIRERILDGMAVEVIMRPIVVASFLAELPDEIIEVCDSNHVTVYLHDDPPCGLAIGDDRVQIGVRDGASRTESMSVDTDSTRVHEWAEGLFESYKDSAVQMGSFSPWGLRRAIKNGGFDVTETVGG